MRINKPMYRKVLEINKFKRIYNKNNNSNNKVNINQKMLILKSRILNINSKEGNKINSINNDKRE